MFNSHCLACSEFMDVSCVLGENVTCSSTLLDDLERFICFMYGKAQYSSVNKLRDNLFSQKSQGTFGQVLGAFADMNSSLLPQRTASRYMHAQKQTTKCIYGAMHTNNFQTYEGLKEMARKLMQKVPFNTNGLVVLYFRRR